MNIGLEFLGFSDLKSHIDQCIDHKFNFVAFPLFRSEIQDYEKFIDLRSSLSWYGSDVALKSDEWCSYVDLKLSSFNFSELLDEIDLVKKCEIMRKELDYVCHLGVSFITIDIDEFTSISCVSQILKEFYSKGKLRCQVVINVPYHGTHITNEEYNAYMEGMINRYENITQYCDFISNLAFRFEISHHLIDSLLLQRLTGIKWAGVVINKDRFIINMKGLPILPKSIRLIVNTLIKIKETRIVFKIDEIIEDFSPYIKYFNHLLFNSRLSHIQDPYENYEDVPQIPLQPLSRNLESHVYEVFEEDPYKYLEYEKAISQYFTDCKEMGISSRNVLLIGAGRGPIINCILNSSKNTDMKVDIIAIEKNEFAIPTLKHKYFDYQNVEIIHVDIRYWNKENYAADLVCSELLGSFGDNELSPECLESSRPFTHESTVFIPSSYTSYICPVSAPGVYSQISSMKEYYIKDPFQIPFVTYLYTSSRLSFPKICFQFDHSNSERFEGNKYKKIRFNIDMPSILHGFAGYFSCKLYGEYTLSINPLNPTPGMFSWLTFFFPLKNPIQVDNETSVDISIWRRTSPSNVWYEWCLDFPQPSIIHNSGAKHYKMNLS